MWGERVKLLRGKKTVTNPNAREVRNSMIPKNLVIDDIR